MRRNLNGSARAQKKAPGIDGSQGGEGLRKVSGSDWTVTTAASVPTLLKSSLVQVVTGFPFSATSLRASTLNRSV